MKKVFTLALAALVGPGCQATQPDPFQSPPIEAEFRWQAREMYASLRRPSCEAPPGFDRNEMLRDEYQAVRLFEKRTQTSPAHFQLVVASADAAFEQAKDEGCWMENSELVWANKHVEMTKESVHGTLGRLQVIAPSLPQVLPNNIVSATDASEFRYLVRRLVWFSRPQCPLTTKAENDQVMGPARSEIVRFREGLKGTPYAANFDIAQADVAYEHSITIAECADPSRTDPAKLGEEAIADVRRQIATIGRQVQSH